MLRKLVGKYTSADCIDFYRHFLKSNNYIGGLFIKVVQLITN